jgi:hypothetical protein
MNDAVDNVLTDIIVTTTMPHGMMFCEHDSPIPFDSREFVVGPIHVNKITLSHSTSGLFLLKDVDFIIGAINPFLFAESHRNKLCRYFLWNSHADPQYH